MYIYVYICIFYALRTRVKSIGPENNIVVTGYTKISFFSPLFFSPFSSPFSDAPGTDGNGTILFPFRSL